MFSSSVLFYVPEVLKSPIMITHSQLSLHCTTPLGLSYQSAIVSYQLSAVYTPSTQTLSTPPFW